MSTFQQWQAEEAERAKQAAELKQERDTSRIETFSDCVFAIAMTLLVLEIKAPPAWDTKPLLQSIGDLYPAYAGYAISFLTILEMWMGHRRLFKLIRRSDDWLPVANGVLLLIVTFVPFSTAVMSEHWLTQQRQIGVLFYTGTFIVMALAVHVLWFCASHKSRLLERNLDRHRVDVITRQYMAGPFMYGIAFVIGFWSPEMCMAMTALYAIFFAIPGITFSKAELKDEEPSE